jgi:nucleotide-binding universal stress UspA family protein
VPPVFAHLLLATDFSSHSERALEGAAALARDLRARVTVLHVYPVFSATPELAERRWPGGVRARARLDRLVDELRRRGLHAEGVLRFGHPPEQVVEAALDRGADLVVTGTRARRGFARFWYGSVAEQVARRSPVPVVSFPASAAIRSSGRRDGRDGPEAIAGNVVPLRRC